MKRLNATELYRETAIITYNKRNMMTLLELLNEVL